MDKHVSQYCSHCFLNFNVYFLFENSQSTNNNEDEKTNDFKLKYCVNGIENTFKQITTLLATAVICCVYVREWIKQAWT